MSRITVVGLGAMGSRIARRLLSQGHDVVVWNRDPAKAEPLIADGVVAAKDPASAAQGAQIVVVMVSDPEALREVTEGGDGLLAGARPGTTVVQMSTVAPAAIERLAGHLPAEVDLLDAPVLGSLSEVDAGTLTVFAGGRPAVVERWAPLLSELGAVIHVGPIGAGTAAKLVANSTLLGTLGVLGEALALGEALGLRSDVTFEVLTGTPLANQADRRRSAVERGDYRPPRFRLSLARKDAALILEAAAGAGLELRLAPAIRTWFDDAESAGRGDQDYSAVLAQILRRRES